MRIHHATTTKAAKFGVILTESGEDAYNASWPKLARSITCGSAKLALEAMLLEQRFGEEYPKLRVLCTTDQIWVFHTEAEGDDALVGSTWDDYNQDDMFVEALEAVEDLGLVEDEDDEEEVVSTVVPALYKRLYRERGNPDNCSDWLADVLQDHTGTTNEKGKRVTDIDAMQAIANANGIDRDWPHLNNGQRAMNWRNMLRKRVCEANVLHLGGDESLVPPADWVATVSKRYKQVAKKK